jgi:GntR family transcriptional regulator
MRILISTTSTTPIYAQIIVQVRAAILSGEVAAGDTLPSLRQLSADLRVSVITVTRAYNDLVAEGLVQNQHGRGFVVLDVDADAASAALAERLDDALGEAVSAAKRARIGLDALHHRLDEMWRTDD